MKTRTFQVGVLRVEVTVDRGQRTLIASRAFRGTDAAKAGNFSEWNDLGEFLDSEDFRCLVLPRLVEEALSSRGTFAFDVEFPDVVGWTTVAYWHALPELAECEEGRLTHGINADFVTNLPAPRTRFVTMIGQGRMPDDTLRITLFNVRPGLLTPPFPRPRHHGCVRVPDELGLVFWHFEDAGDEDEDDWLDDDEDEFDPDYYFDGILGTMVINGRAYGGPFPDDFDHSL